MINTRFSHIAPVLGLLALCSQLPAETMFVILKDSAQQAAPSGALQDIVAGRLQSWGGSDIKHYTVVNMLRVTIAATVLPVLQSDPDIAAIVDAGENAGIIDHLEQYLTNSPAMGSEITEPAVYHGTESFARLIDRIAAERDFTILSGGDFASSNTIPAASEIGSLQPAASGVTQNRHLVLRALAKNSADGNLSAASPQFLADSVSTQAGGDFRFFKIGAGSAFQASLAWDRHFTAGLDPYRRQLGVYLYDAGGVQLAAAATGAIASDAPGDLVLKVKLADNGSSPAGEEPFALAISRQGMESAKGPVLGLNCSHGDAELDCTVSNAGDLTVSGVTAHFHGSDYAVGNIEPGGTRPFSVPTAGYDSGDPHLSVQGEAFGEIIKAAAVSAAPAPPDPPQLSLSCVYSTQTAQATIITCTVSASGGVPITSVTVIASPLSGTQTTVSLGTLSGGQTAQATFTYTASGLRGQILAQGTADQYVISNILLYPVANQPPTAGNPPNCTAEGALADAQPYPAIAGNGTVVVKTQAGCQTSVGHTDRYITGLTVLDYGGGTGNRTVPLVVAANILPDTSTTPLNWTLAVTPNINTQIPVTQSGLTCNFQPTASLPTVPRDGGLGAVTMAVEPNCQWSSTADIPTSGAFVHFVSGPPPYLSVPTCCSTGPGSVQYLIDANPTGIDRTFTLRVGGKILTGVQLGSAPPPCTYSAAATGTLQFAYSGGSGGINITGSPSTCASSISNSTSWLSFTGNVQSGSGTWAATFTAAANVKLNASSPQRTATLVVSAPASGSGTPFSQSFTVTQAGLQCSFTVPSTPFRIPSSGIPQSQPQSFTVGVTNSACQWTATSSSVQVINDGVTQTGKTTYTIQYWAKPATSATQTAHIQVGDQTYDGFYVANDEIKITEPAADPEVVALAGDRIFLAWTYSGPALKATDKVTITTTAPIVQNVADTTLEKGNRNIWFDLKLTAAAVAGTTQKYSVTITDKTVQPNVSATQEFSVQWPKITVTYPPAGKTAEPRIGADPVTWTIDPPGVKIGQVDIVITRGLTAKTIASVASASGTYPLDLSSFDPGTGYTVTVVNRVFKDWTDSKAFTISGIRITSPPTPFLNVGGGIPVTYLYQGAAKTVTVKLVDSQTKAEVQSVTQPSNQLNVNLPLTARVIGSFDLFAVSDASEEDKKTLLVAGIDITGPFQLKADQKAAVKVTWSTAGDAATIGTNCTVKILRPSGGVVVESPKTPIATGSVDLIANLQAPRGKTEDYQIVITSDKKLPDGSFYQAKSVLEVQGK